MTEQRSKPIPEWDELLNQISHEFDRLDEGEKSWLCDRLLAIESLQREIDQLFQMAGGVTACSECDGECCGCGKHHITLTNILSFLIAGEVPPRPDFSRTCPYLAHKGCVLPVGRRPYNCITFFCEQLEDSLSAVDREVLRELDHRLRQKYEVIADRYPAASLRGLWIALEQLGEGQVLRSK